MSQENGQVKGISAHLPGIFQGLIAAAIGGGLSPAVSSVWLHSFHQPAPDWAKGAVPSIAGGIMLPAVYFGAKGYRRFRSRRAHATATAQGDRLAIYVAEFGDDEKSRTAREYIFKSIRKELSREYVELIPGWGQI